MFDPVDAAQRYFGAAQALPAQPPALAVDLRSRLHAIESGDVGLAEWNAVADAWSCIADSRYRACTSLRDGGPDAHPLRLGVKDTIDVAGFATTLGLRRYRHYPARGACALDGLHDVSIVAKLTTTELNIGIGSGCGNPYFPRIDPAGSSTGCAVAVAAGICDLALGTDVLGSVRWPAGRCGVVGLRVTHGPAMPAGVFPLSPAMDAVGWVARSADEMVTAAARAGLPFGTPAPARPLRIAQVAEVAEGDAEPEVLAATDTAAALLTAAGHRVTRARIGELWDCRADAWELCARDAWEGYRVWRARVGDPGELSEQVRRALASGAKIDDARYACLREKLERMRGSLPALFSTNAVDAWLLPLDPDIPLPSDRRRPAASSFVTPDRPDGDVGYTPIASFAGLPAITFPVAVHREWPVPIAMQLVGRPGAEAALLRLACDIERERGDLGLRVQDGSAADASPSRARRSWSSST